MVGFVAVRLVWSCRLGQMNAVVTSVGRGLCSTLVNPNGPYSLVSPESLSLFSSVPAACS